MQLNIRNQDMNTNSKTKHLKVVVFFIGAIVTGVVSVMNSAPKDEFATTSEGPTFNASTFVDIKVALPTVIVDAKYAGSDNFVGTPVDGYRAARALISVEALQALTGVQQQLQQQHRTLKVFDAFRPQRAVDHFVRWAEDIADSSTKTAFYPTVPKSELFERGYIAAKSSHSRGSTVDCTIAEWNDSLQQYVELDMGSPFDYFDPVSWPSDTTISDEARRNRMTLQNIMVAHGFAPYPQEWWHFTLENEPYPETFFDVEISDSTFSQ